MKNIVLWDTIPKVLQRKICEISPSIKADFIKFEENFNLKTKDGDVAAFFAFQNIYNALRFQNRSKRLSQKELDFLWELIMPPYTYLHKR